VIATLFFFSNRQNNPASLLLWGVIGLIAGIVLFIYGFKLLQRRRLILDTPFSKISSASMGMVEVSGQAVGPYTIESPITRRPCYYYRTDVYELKQRGKNKEWVKVAGECMHVPFFVDDNTGRLLIDPRGADLDLHRDFHQEFSSSFFSLADDPPPTVNTFLSRWGVSTSNRIKVEEFCIKPKNALFILGTVTENSAGEISSRPLQDYEPVASTLVRHSLSAGPVSFTMQVRENTGASGQSAGGNGSGEISSSGQEVVQLSTGPGPSRSADMSQQQKVAAALLKAGILAPAAWNAAGLTAPTVQVIAASSPNSSGGVRSTGELEDFDQHPPVVLAKGTNNKTFLISWRSQQEIARSLGWKCALMIWGGPILALLGLYIVLVGEKLL
jgi:hypothetical protein